MSIRQSNRSYKTWGGMIQRCTNPKNPAFDRYGGRGISMCKRWLLFDNFLADMGERPEGLSLDRINVNGDYEKRNCRWANDTEQARNARSNILIEYKGRVMCLTAWAKELGIEKDCAFSWKRTGKDLTSKFDEWLQSGGREVK